MNDCLIYIFVIVYFNRLMDIVKTIRTRRKYLNITQVDLSQMSGLSLATVKDIERGQGNPSLATIRRICEVLGLELSCEVKQTVL